MFDRSKFREKLEDAYDFIFNDTVMTVGSFLMNLFTITASAYYLITNSLPIIPQWIWGVVFTFMLIGSTDSLKDVITLGLDEEEEDEEDYEEDEDDEYVD